jgi:hypothetical protein
MKLHFISFGSTPHCDKSRKRIKEQAENMGVFETINVYSQHDLDPEFLTKYQPWMDSHSKGYGFYIWKPQIISQAIAAIPDGDVWVYLDSGCHLYSEGIKRFQEYVELAREHGFVAMRLEDFHTEYKWTKGDVLVQFPNVDHNSAQIESGIIFCHKTLATTKLISDWLSFLHADIHNFSGYPPRLRHPHFREHRHDQSIFSLLLKSRNFTKGVVQDETYFENLPAEQWPKEFPIHAKRDK